MTTIDLNGSEFPKFKNHVHAKWAPILLEPIAGSYERLVVGCAAVNETDFHLEIANALHRLDCLYGKRSESVIFAIEAAGQALRQDLAKRGISALVEPNCPLSGVHIDSLRDAEGESLEEIARDWMSVLSSLYESDSSAMKGATQEGVDEGAQAARSADRLPQLVLEHVSRNNVHLSQFFSTRIIQGKQSRSAAHQLDIDFKGRRLVANFATLQAHRIGPAVGHIKQRLFDLNVDREDDFTSGKGREHQLIVQVPRPDDPQVSHRQYARLQSEYEGLMEHADKLSLFLKEFNTPGQIGRHLIKREAA